MICWDNKFQCAVLCLTNPYTPSTSLCRCFPASPWVTWLPPFAAMIFTTTTGGWGLTRNVNMGRAGFLCFPTPQNNHSWTNYSGLQYLYAAIESRPPLPGKIYGSVEVVVSPGSSFCAKYKLKDGYAILIYLCHPTEQNPFTVIISLHSLRSITSLLNVVCQCDNGFRRYLAAASSNRLVQTYKLFTFEL